jgi:hypothetical protein
MGRRCTMRFQHHFKTGEKIMAMSEDQIERRVERFIDVLDRALLRGDIDQQAYDELICEVDDWAYKAYQQQKGAIQ